MTIVNISGSRRPVSRSSGGLGYGVLTTPYRSIVSSGVWWPTEREAASQVAPLLFSTSFGVTLFEVPPLTAIIA